MATKTATVTACMPVVYSGGTGVNPGDLHLPVGKWDPGTGIGYSTRLLLKASISLAGMTAITAARLYLYQHTAAGWHAKGSGSVNIEGRRKTSDWSESSGGSGTGTDEIYGGDSGSLVSGGFVDDGGGSSAINNAAADGTLDYVDITSIARAWLAGSPNYGVMIFAADSSTDPDKACEFYSRRQSGKVPYFWIEYETNTAPNAPTGLSPSGGATVHSGRTITYAGTRSDPDSGDSITAYEIEVYSGATKIQTYASPSLSPGGTSFSKALTLPSGYDADQLYEWRARTRDESSVWGAWSAKQSFRANSIPNTPPAPTVELDSLTPTITGSFSDPDGNPPNQAELEVELVSPSTDVWLSGAFSISASPWSKVYAGSVLAWSTAYRARARVRDQYGGWSSWSSWANFTPTQPTGPSNMTPRSTATKVDTLTPTLTVAHSATFRNDEFEVYAGPTTGSTKLYTKAFAGSDYAAVTSKAYVYAGAALAWGATYYWRARIELADGTLSAWSALYPFYVNAEPPAPSELAARNDAAAAVLVSGGIYVVTDTTPLLEALYADPDLEPYADVPSSRTVEIYDRLADGSPGTQRLTNTLASPPHTTPMQYQTTAALAAGDYLVRWRFSDSAARASAWSAYMTLRVTTGPGCALVSPTAGATIVDSTPVLDWSYSSAAGKAQAAYRVALSDLGPTGAHYPDGAQPLHDSGQLAGAQTSYDVPPHLLLDDHDYSWQLTVWDTDGLSAGLA